MKISPETSLFSRFFLIREGRIIKIFYNAGRLLSKSFLFLRILLNFVESLYF